ncbi:MAG: hypothetical protein K2X93_03395 [Candidatus Obscuribacterales bacterium]|nr:hypothetical protein [Candidatus Obscuribacterales bacterium]
MIDDVAKLLSKWLSGQRSNKLMSTVVEAMTEARQKVRASDSPFKSLARKCIDRAEDAYQEAIYQLKDGEPKLCFQHCKQGLKYISMAMLHLSDLNGNATTFAIEQGGADESIIDLSKAIAAFKTSVEYTNCEVTVEMKERLKESVRLFFLAVSFVEREDDNEAKRCAHGGLLYVYLLSKESEEKLQSNAVDAEALERCHGSAISRIVSLIDELSDTNSTLQEASVESHGRIKLYLDAARRTVDRCISAYLDNESDALSQLAKAGMMELRMARRLIEYAKYPTSTAEPEEEPIEEVDQPTDNFRGRVARLQRLLRDEDEEVAVVRRLGVVNTYYSRARALFASGELSEAERYARSAHLDIDFARQLLLDKHATYSDLI